ncbi:MAG: XRE family transcriptional regulator [Oscillospiraceae bacterium]|nr:XRE family transcriptional regulator [Oscillospiraceae bacterium]
MNIANIGEILNIRRREMGLSQAELAMLLRGEGIDVTNQAISKWENGSTLPNAKQFLILCRVLEIDDIGGEFLVGGRGGLLAGLDNMGRKKVREYIELLRSSGLYDAEPEPERCRTLPLYSIAVSAGTGQFLDSEDYEMTEVGPEVPENANFGVRVAGDSMEPQFHDGQTVWIRQQHSLMTGEIGIFLYDGCAYLKQLVAVDDHLALHSLNPAYPDIEISPELPLRVLGKVLAA